MVSTFVTTQQDAFTHNKPKYNLNAWTSCHKAWCENGATLGTLSSVHGISQISLPGNSKLTAAQIVDVEAESFIISQRLFHGYNTASYF
jgi:hypothetical protein